MPVPDPLPVDRLRARCDRSALDFETTATLEPLPYLGQERATEAIELGLGMRRPGYDLFVLGRSAAGKHRMVMDLLESRAGSEPPPDDWCHVLDFADERRPIALRLPPGQGAALRSDMEQLVEEVAVSVRAAFESDEYRNRQEAIAARFQARQEKGLAEVKRKAQGEGITLISTPVGFAFAPLEDGEVLPPDKFRALPKEEQDRIKEAVAQLEQELQAVLREVPRWAKEARTQAREVDREVTDAAVAHLVDDLANKYAALERVATWLGAVKDDIIERAEDFLPAKPSPEDSMAALALHLGRQSSPASRYRVNTLVTHEADAGAPVVYEDHPTLHHLVGRMEHRSELGALVTDFSLITSGALHRANGGYLVLDARKLLQHPHSYDALKRTLFAREVKIQSLGQALELVSSVTLEPEPIPLDVKVVLLGDRRLYYLLCRYDPEFAQLFKISADLEDEVSRNGSTTIEYARMLGTLAGREELRPLTPEAVAEVIEHAARLADDSHKLSLHQGDVLEVLAEADHRAGRRESSAIDGPDIRETLAARERRTGRLRESMMERLEDGTVLLDTEGARVGQINGLSVLQVGRTRWGNPARITARVRIGRGELMDIEREAQLGGPIHSKGVMILSGFLGQRYAAERPLSLSASLVFEQSYGGVDGDSASLAELCVLLSSITRVPIRQDVAVTGSVNQHGDVQPVGGINEKIEGFFEACRRKGTLGTQGVMIPASNVRHLMLRDEAIEACREGRFFIWAVSRVDQALELLTGVEAGEEDETGRFPEGSFNRKVSDRLDELAEAIKAFSRPAPEKEGADTPVVVPPEDEPADPRGPGPTGEDRGGGEGPS